MPVGPYRLRGGMPTRYPSGSTGIN